MLLNLIKDNTDSVITISFPYWEYKEDIDLYYFDIYIEEKIPIQENYSLIVYSKLLESWIYCIEGLTSGSIILPFNLFDEYCSCLLVEVVDAEKVRIYLGYAKINGFNIDPQDLKKVVFKTEHFVETSEKAFIASKVKVIENIRNNTLILL